jgi:hypothetical protein
MTHCLHLITEKELSIPYKYGYDTAADARIGKVEDRTEENVATDKRHPFGPGKKRKIEHVYYPSFEERGVSFAPRDKMGNLAIAGREDLAIEQTIYNIAYGTGQNHCHCKDKARRIFLVLDKLYQQIYKKGNSNYTESCKEQFVKQLHTECHSIILNETDLEPISKYRKAAA